MFDDGYDYDNSVNSFENVNNKQTTRSKPQQILLATLAVLTTAAIISIVVYYTAIVSDDAAAPDIPDIDLGTHRIIYRDEWGGRPPEYTRPLVPPVQYVIISHSAGRFLTTPLQCAAAVQDIQTLHVSQIGSPDIGYNFVVCGDGNIYVGRDWSARNFHMDSSIGICFLGNFMYDNLTDTMIEAAQLLLELGLKTKMVLSEEYKLVGHNQTYNTISPGENVYKVIKEWPHFYPGNVD